MLKKLVKYGNSSALIFDKAILELLEIGEGSILKIRTDGTSLIITPHASLLKYEKVSPTLTYMDAVKDNVIEHMLKQYADLSPERRAELTQEFKELHAKRQEIIERSPAFSDFIKASRIILKKYSDASSPEYLQEYSKLRNAYMPELAHIEDQLLNFEKTHGLNRAEAIMSPSLNVRQTMAPDTMQQLTEAYAHVFKKHAVVYEKMRQLVENPEFIHESQLMVEKSGGKIDVTSPEYRELRYKYVPEARAMDEEMVEVGKKVLDGKPA